VKISAAERKFLSASLLVSGILAAAPSVAFAEETSSGVSLIVPDMSEFIPALVAFLILWFVLAKFAYPAITGMLDKRAATIKESLEQAEIARIEGERLLERYKAELNDAKKQAAAIVADAKKSGESVKADITVQAQVQADEMIAKAQLAIEAEKNQAIAELQSSVADLSVAVAGRIIGEDLSDDEHRKLIERYVKEAGSLNAN
jgi:F-type H+-transporting ATPase subunit b